MYCRMCGKKIEDNRTICDICNDKLKDLNTSSEKSFDSNVSTESVIKNDDNVKQSIQVTQKEKNNFSVNDSILPFTIVLIIIFGCIFFTCRYLLTDYDFSIFSQIMEKKNSDLDNVGENSIPLYDVELFENMVKAACYGDFIEIYRSPKDYNRGLFQCEESMEVYSFSDLREDSYYIYGSAEYYGTTKDDLVEKYFPNAHYLYRNLYNADYHDELILMLEADSEDDLVNRSVDKLYEYIKELNEKYKTDIDITILYTEKLDEVKTTMDYVLLGVYTRNASWLPHGNGFGRYILSVDLDYENIKEIAADPTLYSGQTRDAIKFKRHIFTKVTNGRTITKEMLESQLRNSFVSPE